jgi:3'(2'), 5'-bisphosphate nucleotidase
MRHAKIILHKKMLSDRLKQLVMDVGTTILNIYHREDLGIQVKHDQSPVTAADLAAHQMLVQGLTCLTPQWPIVSEEDQHSQALASNYPIYWLIDPLDGTQQFIRRNGDFTVNVALIEQGSPSLGLVGIPIQAKLYWGGTGLGSYRTTAITAVPDRLKAVTARNPARVLASKSHLNQATQQFIQNLGETTLLQVGSSIKFLTIAEGDADWYPRLAPTCEWDTAAAQAVLEGAGGCVTQLNGKPLQYGKVDMLNPHFVARGKVNIKSNLNIP